MWTAVFWPPSENLPTKSNQTINTMKNAHLLGILVMILLVSCSAGDEVRLRVYNPLDQPRNDAAILLTRGEISNWMDIPEGKLPVLLDKNREPVPCQADDVDRDGQWDELFALIQLAPKGEQELVLRFVPAGDYPGFEARTNLRLGDAQQQGYPELETAERLEGITYYNHTRTGEVYQMEGPAWENDKVGFRNYLDQRNGIDIFGKLTGKMVLDSVGIGGAPSYHEPGEWGMDVLKVGTSLGAGAIGYLYNDSIYRVGDNGSGSYELLFEGSQRSRFNLDYTSWRAGETELDVVHQIEIAGGRHYYQATVTYSGTEEVLHLVPGIVNMKSNELHVFEADPFHTALVTHDLQAEDTTLLAMALMVPTGSMIRYGTSRDSGEGIIQTYYAVLEAGPGRAVPYRFYALWEKEDPGWSSLEEVTGFLKGEAERWTQPVIVQVME
jgi:hypothetical protein